MTPNTELCQLGHEKWVEWENCLRDTLEMERERFEGRPVRLEDVCDAVEGEMGRRKSADVEGVEVCVEHWG